MIERTIAAGFVRYLDGAVVRGLCIASEWMSLHTSMTAIGKWVCIDNVPHAKQYDGYVDGHDRSGARTDAASPR